MKANISLYRGEMNIPSIHIRVLDDAGIQKYEVKQRLFTDAEVNELETQINGNTFDHAPLVTAIEKEASRAIALYERSEEERNRLNLVSVKFDSLADPVIQALSSVVGEKTKEELPEFVRPASWGN